MEGAVDLGSTATINVTAEGTTTVTFSARDNHGNVEQAKNVTVRLDKTAPAVNITSPTASAVYTLGQSVSAGFNCNDGRSGVATCTGTAANGSVVNTASAGTKEFSVTATDAAGNTAQKSVSYTVSYGVVALYDQTKAHKSGSTIPIKLQLTNASGANLSSPGLLVTALGTYALTFRVAGDPVTHTLQFRVTK